jgi:hypothetical protein
VALAQIQAAVAATGNFCFFSYGSLYATREGSSARQMETRAANVHELVPYVQSLAASAAAVKGS